MAKKPKPKAVRKAVPKLEREPIRDHGEVITAPAGTTQQQVIANLAGTDKVPSLEELGRAKAPPFDPHVGREVAPGREFGGEPEAMISTLVFIGVDHGGDFEDGVQQLVAAAEALGFKYVTATVGRLDLELNLTNLANIDEATTLAEPDEFDVEDDDGGERF